MLLPARVARGVRDGSITLAFRAWEQPRVRVGGRQLTAAGIIEFVSVDEVMDPAAITDDEAIAAGFADADAVRAVLAGKLRVAGDEPPAPRRVGPRGGRGGDRVFRVRLAWVGEDPRVQLRQSIPKGADLGHLTAAVAKLDAGRRTGPWTRPILEWIRDHPGVISTELASLLGRELQPLKADIRRLKTLGLTESLRVGYRLSPRGAAYLESLG